jgi:hypothetical protein
MPKFMDIPIVTSTDVPSDTIYCVPQSLRCPTCNDQVGAQRVAQIVTCPRGHAHGFKDFAPQFGVIRNVLHDISQT